MDGSNVHTNRASFGEITIEEAPDLLLRSSGTTTNRVHRHKSTWRPPNALQQQLPAEFELPLQIVTDADGFRRFYPWNRFETFLALATTGGLAILCHRQNLTANQRHSYRIMRFLFLRAHRMVEHFRHRFDSSLDLTIALSGRRNPEERDILPEDVGLDARGRGRWGVTELIRRGETTACAAGYRHPTMALCIRYGLMEAARLSPLPLADEKVPQLIHASLFNVGRVKEPAPGLVELVTERLLTAMPRHLEENSRTFEKWFLGGKNSLVHQLAKQERSPGGALEEDDVRQVFLHLGWQAYGFAANCVHAQMRIFQNALSEPLTERERLLFEHMHLRQSYLGNLPLVLLAPRLGSLQGLLWEHWEGLPDMPLVPVIYRLLDYYSTMAGRRREADRLIKNGLPRRLVEEAHFPAAEGQRFQEIAAAVRELDNIDCGCPRRDWWAELKGRPGAMIRVLHQCIACDFQKETVLTRKKFAEIGQAVL